MDVKRIAKMTVLNLACTVLLSLATDYIAAILLPKKILALSERGLPVIQAAMITSYSGKTIEILNTNAEGRPILADAVTYAVRDEKVTSVLDIATLTGSVVNLFGFSIGGVISDSEDLKRQFLLHPKNQESIIGKSLFTRNMKRC